MTICFLIIRIILLSLLLPSLLLAGICMLCLGCTLISKIWIEGSGIIYLPFTKGVFSKWIQVCLVKAMVFPVAMYGCESWTIKKTEHQGIDAFELWCVGGDSWGSLGLQGNPISPS